MDDFLTTADATVPPDDDQAITLARYAERAYLDYAVSVVKGRALPDVCDGLKPVQRRILYSMDAMGLGPNTRPVKSARVVGDVLGRFHPHGDQSAYDALVRLAQTFTLRYPLIDGQGNFGSRDGDGAAAMRYTEARLTPYARLLLDEIGAGTVDFVPNYDGSTEEPRLLPSRLPMVLLNGASGIAVGLATEIPPHNLREVAAAAVVMLRDGDSLDAVLERLPGPDFPGGGQIISSASELREIYAGGRGSIKVRASWKIEELARGQWQLVVTELPHGTSAQKVLEEIEDLTNPRPRLGKKSVSPEQLQLKQTILSVLERVRDESGREASVRLVFEPRSSRLAQSEFINVLLAHTSLETSVPCNLVMIGLDGRPRQKGLIDILREWCDFRIATVTRRTRHRLERVDDRIHILEGRLLVLLSIDEVIATIREADEPKSALMTRFLLSERQAEDVLEIRLRQLARLESIKIEQELAALQTEKASLEALLGDSKAMRRQVIREVEQDAKLYGDPRRTRIEAATRAVAEVRIVDEAVTVIVSEKGWVRTRQGHGHDATQASFKPGDAFDGSYEVRSTDALLVIASDGRVFSVSVSALPGGRGDGQPVTSLIDLAAGSKVSWVLAAPSDGGIVLATTGGNGLACLASDWIGRNRSGKSFLTIEPDDVLLRPVLLGSEAAGNRLPRFACLSSGGRLLTYPVSEVKLLRSGGRGSSLMGLDAGEQLVAVEAYGASGILVCGTGRASKSVERSMSARELANYEGARGRKGRLLEPRVKEGRLVRIDAAVPTSDA
jgi:topoisomerase-4 subunit A